MLFFQLVVNIIHMKTIALISQKGGSGKSTLAISLACEAENNELQTLLIDTDQQASVYKWFRLREDDYPFTVATQGEAVSDELDKYSQAGADLAIIDTAGVSSTASISIAKQSDMVIIPSRASAIDLQAIEDSINIAKLAGKTPYVLFNAIHPSAKKAFEEIKEVAESVYGASVIPYFVSQRSTFSHCMIGGQSPQEYEPNGKAHHEIEQLYSWLANKLSLQKDNLPT